ncbi:HIRAN domain-containing protein [Planococcus antarcticus DSM 14505]|uniref:HIRAN domain-containing protein n=1 Tax=Planococcus antarcticus DSM 14505 TaxID=1185653 RepID=A0AA87IK95_9BACL|nr:HIRAN domain-containing protein [Planococcus antarcticus]EIM06220.1 HIRAN domain-containing protein [Planococcus antarcticus DSM 14505]
MVDTSLWKRDEKSQASGTRTKFWLKVLNQLQVGDSIEFALDPENVHDHRAVEVHTQSGDKLGFIPAFYSGWMFEIIAKNCSYEAKVEAIHPLAVDHRKVSISIVGEVNRSVDIQEVLEDKDELRVIMY